MRKAVSDLRLPSEEDETFKNFFRCINLCHDCITLKEEITDKKTGAKSQRIVYNGPSVDEVCLLEMCDATGLGVFNTRDATCYDITVDGQKERYEQIKLFEFTSERKAMSMVVLHPTKPNTAICFVKGADSSVFPMCSDYKSAKD